MTWALVVDGVVVETTEIDPAGRFHRSLTWIDITGSPSIVPGWTYSGAAGFMPPAGPQSPTPQQQSDRLLAQGLHVVSASTPTLNGWYAVDAASRANIVAIETSLNAGRGFPPNNASEFSYPDMSWFYHVFDTEQFTNFAAAVRDFYYACVAYASGATQTPPSGEANIQ